MKKRHAGSALGYQLGALGVQGWQYERQRGVAWHPGVPPEPHSAAGDDGGGEGRYAMVAETVRDHSHSLERYKAQLQLDNTAHGGAAVTAAAELLLTAARDVPAAAAAVAEEAAAVAEEAAAAAAAAVVHLIAAAVTAAAAAGVIAAASVSPVAEFAAWAGSREWT